MLIDHDVGLEKNYYPPTLNDLLQEYLKAVDLLTIEESHRLTRKVQELTEERDEITLMKLSHEKEMKEMRVQLDHIVSLIQENPKLAKVKQHIVAFEDEIFTYCLLVCKIVARALPIVADRLGDAKVQYSFSSDLSEVEKSLQNQKEILSRFQDLILSYVLKGWPSRSK